MYTSAFRYLHMYMPCGERKEGQAWLSTRFVVGLGAEISQFPRAADMGIGSG